MRYTQYTMSFNNTWGKRMTSPLMRVNLLSLSLSPEIPPGLAWTIDLFKTSLYRKQNKLKFASIRRVTYLLPSLTSLCHKIYPNSALSGSSSSAIAGKCCWCCCCSSRRCFSSSKEADCRCCSKATRTSLMVQLWSRAHWYRLQIGQEWTRMRKGKSMVVTSSSCSLIKEIDLLIKLRIGRLRRLVLCIIFLLARQNWGTNSYPI